MDVQSLQEFQQRVTESGLEYGEIALRIRAEIGVEPKSLLDCGMCRAGILGVDVGTPTKHILVFVGIDGSPCVAVVATGCTWREAFLSIPRTIRVQAAFQGTERRGD